ncbi:MAG: hypothetical protein M3Y09_14025 [Actinomycetota bacterium]|nr:hypothetical protein [Actinomycetota bacterium]
MICLGQNGSGKSVFENVLFSTGYRCQRLLLDSKDEFTIDGVEPITSVDAIDWAAPVIHYIDDRGDLREYDRLFRACLQRKAGRAEGPRRYGLLVCVHELGDLCGDSPGKTGQWVSAYIRKGRAHGLGLLGGSQRPVNMPKAARTEAQHVFAFAPGFDPDDRAIVAKMMGVDEHAFDELLRRAAALSPTGEHSFVWFDKRAKTIQIRAPLPANMLAQSIIRGLEP